MPRKTTFFPPAFLEKYQELLGKDFEPFLQASKTKQPKCLWANSLKIAPGELKKELEREEWKLTALPFHANAFEVREGPLKPAGHLLFRTGHFNLQEKASMLPALVLDPRPGERVLDCTAAPGNKTLQLACLLRGEGEIAAVEISPKRAADLEKNIKKFGAHNVRVQCTDFLHFEAAEPFQRILLDAPCSNEGWVRKRREALKQWSEKSVKRKAKQQKRLLLHAFDLLEKGGSLVYSVCTLSPEECEGVVQQLLKKREDAVLEKIEIPGITPRPGLSEYRGKEFPLAMRNCARLYPQDNDTQAFFLAKVLKK